MKRKLAILSVVVLGLLAIPVIQAGAAITTGTKCSKAGIQGVYKMKIFTCVKSGSKLVWNKGVSYYLLIPTPTPTVTITASPEPVPTVTVTATPVPAPTVTITATPKPAPTVTVTATPVPAPTVTITATPSPSISTTLGTYNNPVSKGEKLYVRSNLIPSDYFSVSIVGFETGVVVSEEICVAALTNVSIYTSLGLDNDKVCSRTFRVLSVDNSKFQYIRIAMKITNEDYNDVFGMQSLLGYVELHLNDIGYPGIARPALAIDSKTAPKNVIIGPKKTITLDLYCYLPSAIRASDLESGMLRFNRYNEKGNAFFKLGNS